MTHPEYPSLRKLFLQWMLMERLVLFHTAEVFFEKITCSIDFGDDLDNEKGAYIICFVSNSYKYIVQTLMCSLIIAKNL